MITFSPTKATQVVPREEVAAQVERLRTTETVHPTNRISNHYSGMKVLGLVADNSACGYYRVINPIHMLGQMGAEVHYSSHHNLETFLKYDIIIAPRQHNAEVYEILRFVSWEDKCIIFEIDDDLDAVMKDSPAYPTYHPEGQEVKNIHKFISKAHGLTTSTYELGKWYSQSNRNVRILGNYIDFSLRDWHADVKWEMGSPIITPRFIEKPKEWEGYTVIEWSGGSTHTSDLKLIGPAIKNILEKYENTLFVFYSSVEGLVKLIEEAKLPKDRVVHIPARHFLDHPKALFGADIHLAPLVCNQFNLAKTDLKFLESATAGAAVIGSNVGPYARLSQRHPGIFSLVGEGKDCFPTWESAIEYLINNPEERMTRAVKGRQLVFDNYSLESNVHLWPTAWRSIIAHALSGDLGPPDQVMPRSKYKSYGTTKAKDPCPCSSGLQYRACCRDAWGPAGG